MKPSGYDREKSLEEQDTANSLLDAARELFGNSGSNQKITLEDLDEKHLKKYILESLNTDTSMPKKEKISLAVKCLQSLRTDKDKEELYMPIPQLVEMLNKVYGEKTFDHTMFAKINHANKGEYR